MPVSPANLKQLADLVKEQSKRINRLENEVKKLKGSQDHEEQKSERPEKIGKAKSKIKTPISPTTILTTVGIIGVIIGLVSFFKYAVSNNWIGPIAQISIGIIVGLALFAAGYLLYDKHPKWAVTCFGGAIVVELISIGFGIWYYSLINKLFAFMLLLIFLSAGIMLSLKYDSLLIAYFSIVGGVITPVISKIYTEPIFTSIFLLLLAIGVLVLSNYKKWTSIRMVSFLSIFAYETYLFNPFRSEYGVGLSAEASIFFLTLFFLVYNISSIIFSVRQDKRISALDITLLNLNTFLSAILLTKIFFLGDEIITRRIFGVILLVISLFFMAEMYYIRTKYAKNNNLKPTLYSLLSSGIILINIGLVLISSTGQFINIIILALPQWVLYCYLSKATDDKKYYGVFSYIFLAIALSWWLRYLLRFPSQMDKATFVICMMLIFLAALFVFTKKGFLKSVNSFLLILLGFTFFSSLMDYIKLITNISGDVTTTILSGLWLAYALTLYIKTREKEKFKLLSRLSLSILIIALIKIAFFDLTRLEGVVKIIGFMVFGVLLLVGGYLLKK